MRHICNAYFGGYEFGIAIDKSIDNPGMFRLVDETDGSEIQDMFDTKEDAIEAIYVMYPDNDITDEVIADVSNYVKWQDVVDRMNNEIRETVHNDIDPCTDEEFIVEYNRRHREVFGEYFDPEDLDKDYNSFPFVTDPVYIVTVDTRGDSWEWQYQLESLAIDRANIERDFLSAHDLKNTTGIDVYKSTAITMMELDGTPIREYTEFVYDALKEI